MFAISSTPTVEAYVTSKPLREADAEPDFVVITITPFAARVPYKLAAAAPFNTVMLCMSFGSKSEIRLEKAPPPVKPPDPSVELKSLLYGIPSTTNNGWLFPNNDEFPLMVMRVELPGAPLEPTMFTPGTFPDMALNGSGSETCTSLLPETVSTE